MRGVADAWGVALAPARSLHDDRPRLLMLTHRVPYPPDRGDRIRSWNLLRHLSARFAVSVACVSDEGVTDEQRSALEGVTAQLAIAPLGRWRGRARGAWALGTGGAVTPAVLWERGLARRVVRWHEAMPFDAVLTFCSGMIRYAEALMRSPHRPRHVLDLVDVDSLKWASLAGSARWPMRWVYAAESRRLRPIERGGVASPDAITVISDEEAKRYRQEVSLGGDLRVVGNGVDLACWRPLPDRREAVIAFVGVLDYAPNVQGIGWFAREVLPLVRRRRPDAELRVIGRRPTRAVLALGALPGVRVVGSVADVRAELAASSVVVAPLAIAPGVQNKVLEAMACRRAVVCTPAAAAGIAGASGTHFLSASEPLSFAHQVSRLLGDAGMRMRVAAAGRALVEARYTWERQLAPMAELLAPGRAGARVTREAA